jgi:hypothetical protein
VTPFVTAHVRAQCLQVFALATRQRTEGMLWIAIENLLEDLGLPARLANALYDSFFERDVTTGYYRDLADTSPATARNDLVAARAAGLLASEGRTRGRRWLPGPRLLALIADAAGVDTADHGAIARSLADRAVTDIGVPSFL